MERKSRSSAKGREEESGGRATGSVGRSVRSPPGCAAQECRRRSGSASVGGRRERNGAPLANRLATDRCRSTAASRRSDDLVDVHFVGAEAGGKPADLGKVQRTAVRRRQARVQDRPPAVGRQPHQQIAGIDHFRAGIEGEDGMQVAASRCPTPQVEVTLGGDSRATSRHWRRRFREARQWLER